MRPRLAAALSVIQRGYVVHQAERCIGLRSHRIRCELLDAALLDARTLARWVRRRLRSEDR